jgi:hypothetical protein
MMDDAGGGGTGGTAQRETRGLTGILIATKAGSAENVRKPKGQGLGLGAARRDSGCRLASPPACACHLL